MFPCLLLPILDNQVQFDWSLRRTNPQQVKLIWRVFVTKRVVQPNFAVKLGLSSESSRFILLCLLYLGQYRRLAANDLQVEFVGYRPPGQIDTCCHSLLSQPVVHSRDIEVWDRKVGFLKLRTLKALKFSMCFHVLFYFFHVFPTPTRSLFGDQVSWSGPPNMWRSSCRWARPGDQGCYHVYILINHGENIGFKVV